MTKPDPVLLLLWRGVDGRASRGTEGVLSERRGPKPKASLDTVVRAAVQLADHEGLAALSIRALARRLGMGAMSLYTYVPGRDELVILMVDDVLGESPRTPHSSDPRRRLESVAKSAYDELFAHPWLTEVDSLRAWLGPNAAERYEWQLRAVDGLGLSDVDMGHAVTLLEGIAATAVRATNAVVSAERRSGQTELQWWNANARALAALMGDREYPLAARISQAAGDLSRAATDPDGQFRFALNRVINGLLGG